jgi:hypothetical protein
MPLIFMGVFDNNVLKMYLLNTQLSFHQNSFDYFILFISFIKQFFSEVYDLFHTSRLSSLDPYQPSTASRAHMEKIMYQSLLNIPRKCRGFHSLDIAVSYMY